MVSETNWAGNYRYQARRLHRPATLERLREVVAGAPRIRVLGSRHSFTDIADSDELVSLAGLPTEVAVDHDAGTVTCSAGLTYGELARTLQREEVALHNLASLPHISVAGAVATATHGSGDAKGNLATAVAGLELVTSSGELVQASRGDPDFDGLVVGLGALGVVTRLTLEVEPAYQVAQRVFEGLAWDALVEHFDAVTGAGDSVSVFTRWGQAVDQVWVKRRVTDEPEQVRGDLFGATAATLDRHPIIELDPVNCTPQLGVPGRWSDRLPHFRMGFTPSSGAELQSEYLIPRRHAGAAIAAVRALAELVRPVLQVSELRTVAADRLWMSPQYGQDTVAIHFTWHPDPAGVQRVLVELEAALAACQARPHWGKVFLADATTIAPLYERLPDFRDLVDRLDPRGGFRNPWLTDHVLGAAPLATG
jgi:xylitol oxidase